MKRRRAERGFSLLEILIALGVLSLVAGLALTSFKPLRDAEGAESQARALALWLEHERGLSLKQRKARRVWIGRAGAPGEDAFAAEAFAREPVALMFYPEGETSGARLGFGAVAVSVDALTGRIEVARR